MSFFYKHICFFMLGMGLLLMFYGCIREDTDGCAQYAVSVKIVDAENHDITSTGAVVSVNLYLFDQNGFLRMVPKGTSTDYLIGEASDKDLTLVAWGNLETDSLEVPELFVGTSLEDARIALLKRSNGNNLPSSDLFYNRLDLNADTRTSVNGSSSVIVLQRLVAGISIRTNALEKYFGASAKTWHIIVHGAGDSLNFLGCTTGKQSGYEPETVLNASGDLYVPPFRIFPTEQDGNLTIDLYRGQNKVFSTSMDEDGNTLRAPTGKILNLNIDFSSAHSKIIVTVSDWEDITQNTDM